MAYNFNDPKGPGLPRTDSPTANATTTPAPFSPGPSADHPAAPSAAAEPAALSAGWTRFRSCRWRQPAEDGNPEFCTHREVKPYAGTTAFDPDAWCTDCAYYKLRRAPRKRQPEDTFTY